MTAALQIQRLLRLHQADCFGDIRPGGPLTIRSLKHNGGNVFMAKEEHNAAPCNTPAHQRWRVELRHVHHVFG